MFVLSFVLGRMAMDSFASRFIEGFNIVNEDHIGFDKFTACINIVLFKILLHDLFKFLVETLMDFAGEKLILFRECEEGLSIPKRSKDSSRKIFWQWTYCKITKNYYKGRKFFSHGKTSFALLFKQGIRGWS